LGLGWKRGSPMRSSGGEEVSGGVDDGGSSDKRSLAMKVWMEMNYVLMRSP
jgi:hypothetical protein